MDTSTQKPKGPPALSQSIANTLLSRSPFHAWHEHKDLGGLSRRPTKEMDTGTLVHELVLGGSKVVVHDFPDWRTAKARTARDETRADGRTPILRKQMDAVQIVVDGIMEALDQSGLSPRNFVLEHELEWSHGDVPCRGTPDAYLIDGDSAHVYDLKTTKSIDNLLATGRKAAGAGWAIQREAYVSAIEALYPAVAGRVVWHWAIAEMEAPYQVRIVGARPSMIELGRLQWERAVVTWGDLLKRGWNKPWEDDWSAGLEAPAYELARETEALDELMGRDE